VSKPKKIIFFAPHSALWVHAFPEALVAESLVKSGHEVVYVTCGEQFKEFCIPMRGSGLKQESSAEEKAKICKQCNEYKYFLRKQFGFKGYDLAAKISQEEKLQTDELLKSVTVENFREFRRDGVNLGRIALYEFLLQHKKLDYSFNDQEWSRFLIALKNVIYSYFASRRILSEENPDCVITYNALYSVNNVFCRLAEVKGIPYYHLHSNSNLAHRLDGLYLAKGHSIDFIEEMKASWSKFKNVPCNAKEISFITDHLLELFKGTNAFAYSAPTSGQKDKMRAFFGARPDQTLIVAALSSYDESFAYDSMLEKVPVYRTLFTSQVQWVQALVKYFKDRPEIFVVIRVHPREFPNRRETTKSLHAQILEKELVKLPPNFKVNWPSDGISIYDMANETSVFLTGWSSIGKEMGILGLPVLIYTPDWIGYNSDINYLGGTEKEYFEKFEQALKDGWSFENIRRSYRWYAVEQIRPILDISDSYKVKEFSAQTLLERAIYKGIRFFDPFFRLRIDCLRRKQFLKEKDRISQIIEQGFTSPYDLPDEKRVEATEKEETMFIRQDMKRLMKVIHFSKNQ
jgi:hypothetical protein